VDGLKILDESGEFESRYLLQLQGDTLYEIDGPETIARGRSSYRSDIFGFSDASRRRLRNYLLASDADYRVFGTLTYPTWVEEGRDPATAKIHLKRFLERVRRKFRPSINQFSLLWFMEFTRADLVHFHFFATDFIDKDWLSQAWYDCVETGETLHLKAGTRIEALKGERDVLVRYALKYAAKPEQKVIPVGVDWCGRWWGVLGLKSTVEAGVRLRDNKNMQKSAQNEQISSFIGKILLLEAKKEAIPIKLKSHSLFMRAWKIKSRRNRVLICGWLIMLGERLRQYPDGVDDDPFILVGMADEPCQ
jgi:hypothetical protein